MAIAGWQMNLKGVNVMIIQHNLASMGAFRQSKITTARKAKTSERLASGYRINQAPDDAAGLTISQKMRVQTRGLDQANENIQDGSGNEQISRLYPTSDGGYIGGNYTLTMDFVQSNNDGSVSRPPAGVIGNGSHSAFICRWAHTAGTVFGLIMPICAPRRFLAKMPFWM